MSRTVANRSFPERLRPSSAGSLARLRSAEPIELGSGQLSAGFTSGCLTTDLVDRQPLHVIVKKQGGKWRVASVRTATVPPECELVPNGSLLPEA